MAPLYIKYKIMRTINWQSYIKKDTKDNSIWWSYRDKIEASLQSKAALLKAASIDSYYKRLLDLNNN